MQYKWSLGILVVAGYGDGAWLRSVEFFDFKKGFYLNLLFLIDKFFSSIYMIGKSVVFL
jgi:hypothetical protein